MSMIKYFLLNVKENYVFVHVCTMTKIKSKKKMQTQLNNTMHNLYKNNNNKIRKKIR